MYSFKTKIRVRYNETDKMGYLHHGCYPAYFEIARTEMLRHLGTNYLEIENSGIFMPIYELHINYRLPAFYDEELMVTSEISFFPVVRLVINYKIHNEKEHLICEASSTNVYVSAKTRKPVRAPEYLLKLFSPFFNSKEND
jgi:acyl-CoA thioester hydrolase